MTYSNLCHSHRPYTIKEEQAYTGKDGNKGPLLQNRRTVSCPGRSQRNCAPIIPSPKHHSDCVGTTWSWKCVVVVWLADWSRLFWSERSVTLRLNYDWRFLTIQLVRVRFSTGVDTCVGHRCRGKELAGQHKGAKVISERTNQSVAKVIILSP